MAKIISKTYGEKDYKGFILLKNKKTNKVTKHYISHVSNSVFNSNTVNLSFRNGRFDSVIEYKMGTNKNVDIGIKTWVKERTAKNRYVSNDLPESCFAFLFGNKRRNKK